MALELTVPGGSPLQITQMSLIRALGEPVTWQFVVEASREQRGGPDVERVAKLLLQNPLQVKCRSTGSGNAELGPPAKVVGARWQPRALGEVANVDMLEIEAQSTAPASSPDPFVPRRRVHQAKNMKDLVRQFSHVAEPVKALLGELAEIQFPDQEKSSIIQDGVSDWNFFSHILDQCQFLKQGKGEWLPLTLLGSVDENAGTAGRWIMCPGVKTAYQQWGDVPGRTIRFTDGREADGEGRIEFSKLESMVRVPDFPSACFPTVVWWRPRRKFQPNKWQQWRTFDLPRFDASGGIVWRIEDRLYKSEPDGLAWETKLFSAPAQAAICGPVGPWRLRPWSGTGKVDQTSAKGPWLRVRLAGFESGQDAADVRLTTPFSGSTGKRGLHMVPMQGTEVRLSWSGRFDSSVFIAGNGRSEATDFDSPSIYLEDTLTSQYADISCRRVGNIGVDSNFFMAIKQQTQVSSSRQLKIDADSADLKMVGGIVYTGRGV